MLIKILLFFIISFCAYSEQWAECRVYFPENPKSIYWLRGTIENTHFNSGKVFFEIWGTHSKASENAKNQVYLVKKEACCLNKDCHLAYKASPITNTASNSKISEIKIDTHSKEEIIKEDIKKEPLSEIKFTPIPFVKIEAKDSSSSSLSQSKGPQIEKIKEQEEKSKKVDEVEEIKEEKIEQPMSEIGEDKKEISTMDLLRGE